MEEKQEEKPKTPTEKEYFLYRESLKRLRLQQCLRLYDAKTEMYNKWFRYFL